MLKHYNCLAVSWARVITEERLDALVGGTPA